MKNLAIDLLWLAAAVVAWSVVVYSVAIIFFDIKESVKKIENKDKRP